MKSARWLISYVVIAFAGLGMAFLLSLKFTTPAHSQTGKLEAPSAGDLPAEFLNETGANSNKTAPPSGTSSSAGSAAAKEVPGTTNPPPQEMPPPPPPPRAEMKAPAKSVPSNNPPPANNVPPSADGVVSDGATAPAAAPALGRGDEYVYDPTGRRDPFMPYRGILPMDKGRTGENKQVQLDPLQRWDVDRLKVIGILWEVNSPRAMIKDPDGLIYTVMKNTKIGRNNGYVAAIREGEVVIVQAIDFEGTVSKETKILELGK